MINKPRTFFGFLDFLFQLLFVMLILPHNPQVEAKTDQPGTLAVEITWPAELNTDVDLWVRAPNDVPVGFSNRGGQVFNLLRDDMGHVNDRMDLNFENAFTRGIPAGEYIVNLHLYSNAAGVTPVPVQVRVYKKDEGHAPVTLIHESETNLNFAEQEVTIIRFLVDQEGNILSDSFHSLFKSIRPQSGGSP